MSKREKSEMSKHFEMYNKYQYMVKILPALRGFSDTNSIINCGITRIRNLNAEEWCKAFAFLFTSNKEQTDELWQEAVLLQQAMIVLERSYNISKWTRTNVTFDQMRDVAALLKDCAIDSYCRIHKTPTTQTEQYFNEAVALNIQNNQKDEQTSLRCFDIENISDLVVESPTSIGYVYKHPSKHTHGVIHYSVYLSDGNPRESKPMIGTQITCRFPNIKTKNTQAWISTYLWMMRTRPLLQNDEHLKNVFIAVVFRHFENRINFNEMLVGDNIKRINDVWINGRGTTATKALYQTMKQYVELLLGAIQNNNSRETEKVMLRYYLGGNTKGAPMAHYLEDIECFMNLLFNDYEKFANTEPEVLRHGAIVSLLRCVTIVDNETHKENASSGDTIIGVAVSDLQWKFTPVSLSREHSGIWYPVFSTRMDPVRVVRICRILNDWFDDTKETLPQMLARICKFSI